MNIRLFLSTFVLIFLAELGDKTQLAAMARAATGEGGKWTVFFAASGALVLSTLIAVLFGEALTRVIPEHVIKIAAGILFILFGLWILLETLAPERIPRLAGRPGIMSQLALEMAAEFEQASVRDYRQLIERTDDPKLNAILEFLADQEAQHLAHIREANRSGQNHELQKVRAGRLPSLRQLKHDVAGSSESVIEHALRHERATARFYEELARDATLPGLRTTFLSLAAEEQEHVRQLETFAEAHPAAV